MLDLNFNILFIDFYCLPIHRRHYLRLLQK